MCPQSVTTGLPASPPQLLHMQGLPTLLPVQGGPMTSDLSNSRYPSQSSPCMALLQQQPMDIQFLIEQQASLESLCLHYLLNPTRKPTPAILNSILMSLALHPAHNLTSVFAICLRIVDEHKSDSTAGSTARTMQDKENIKAMLVLLREIANKYTLAVKGVPEGDLLAMARFVCAEMLCAVCGNDAVALLGALVRRCTEAALRAGVLAVVEPALLGAKMHVGSYRQSTRLGLYALMLAVLQGKASDTLTGEYVRRVVGLIEDEKDPRNIADVFQIYLSILNTASLQVLTPLQSLLFDSLQMYYPIDFEGDTSQHSINLSSIACLLDQCLTHALFAPQLQTLLMTKMGAAPIGKYIPTFFMTSRNQQSVATVQFWLGLLTRTSEEQYLQEQYSEGAEYVLADLIVQLLCRLLPQGRPISIAVYSTIIKWLDRLLVGHVLDYQHNAKHAGTIINMLKAIITKSHNLTVKHILTGYAINKFLSHTKHAGDILFKLGMLVPILQPIALLGDIETIGLLVLTLSQLYHQAQQPQPRLIILKLYMLLARNQVYRNMITKTNIHIVCRQAIEQEQMEVKVAKSYMDFMVEVYPGELRAAVGGLQSRELRVYGLAVLMGRWRNGDVGSQGWVQVQAGDVGDLVPVLGMLKADAVLRVLGCVDGGLPQEQAMAMCRVAEGKLADYQVQSTMLEFLQTHITTNMMLFFTKSLWRAHLTTPPVLEYIRDRLISWSSLPDPPIYLPTLLAYFNKSLAAFSLPSDLSLPAPNTPSYHSQLHRMLPVQPHHIYTPQQCSYWPTLIHHAWRQSPQLRPDLIEHLPTPILKAQAHRILPHLIKDQKVVVIAKILGNLPVKQLVGEIVPFVLGVLEGAHEGTEAGKLVECNRVLHLLEGRAKEEPELHGMLVGVKGRVLVAIEERLLQHSKRRVRQSARMVFSLYNGLK